MARGSAFDASLLHTPAFIYDADTIADACRRFRGLSDAVGCCPLFSLKSFSFVDAVRRIVPPLGGLAASSLFEARLARDVIGDRGTVHLTTPGLRTQDIGPLAKLCDYISFNSLSQCQRFLKTLCAQGVRCGLRVNPQLSFVDDDRFDPCRKHSKLGVPLDQLCILLQDDPQRLDGITGLHFHNNCESSQFEQLLATVKHIEAQLGPFLKQLEWVNVGGGYELPDDDHVPHAFASAILRLRDGHGLEVFVEPGSSLVRDSGYLVSSVLDLFSSDGRAVAVLDTSVNHMPEVYEYQFEPDVLGHRDGGRFQYILTGRTCLAGDLFGEYAFDEPLEVGSRLVFPSMAAYTLVKAHTFNGVNLPTVYEYSADHGLTLKHRFEYRDFERTWRRNIDAPVRARA